jgi:hypothetical protein
MKPRNGRGRSIRSLISATLLTGVLAFSAGCDSTGTLGAGSTSSGAVTGTVYRANAGQCVYGVASDLNDWSIVSCGPGNFQVVARYPGTADSSRCKSLSAINYTWDYQAGSAGLEVVLCLSMAYPDDLARAPMNSCFKLNSDDKSVTNVSSCGSGDIYLTGRTFTYDDPSFCGNDGSIWWEPGGWPSLGYTVCYRSTS